MRLELLDIHVFVLAWVVLLDITWDGILVEAIFLKLENVLKAQKGVVFF